MLGKLLLGLWLVLGAGLVKAELRLAVAANIADTMEAIATDYQQQTGQSLAVIRGSSGKLYAQIVQGAPFDVFFSADVNRPKALASRGLIVEGSRQTYALGRLVLWPAEPSAEQTLRAFNYPRFAIANPRLAPYGRAASEVLTKLGIRPGKNQLVRGENISQAYQYVHSGNAAAGLLARSQMRVDDRFWELPRSWYQPIEQQRVVLVNSQNRAAAERFLQYLNTPRAQQILRDAGYDLPEGS